MRFQHSLGQDDLQAKAFQLCVTWAGELVSFALEPVLLPSPPSCSRGTPLSFPGESSRALILLPSLIVSFFLSFPFKGPLEDLKFCVLYLAEVSPSLRTEGEYSVIWYSRKPSLRLTAI